MLTLWTFAGNLFVVDSIKCTRHRNFYLRNKYCKNKSLLCVSNDYTLYIFVMLKASLVNKLECILLIVI